MVAPTCTSPIYLPPRRWIAVRRARRNSLHVPCKVAPHHFVLTESAVGEYNTNAKMNPPLRAESDRRAMLEGLLDGSIDCIATDHAPHAAHEEREFERAPNGIPRPSEAGVGPDSRTAASQAQGLAQSSDHALLSTQPANLLNLRGRGTLACGSLCRRGHLRSWGGMDLFAQRRPVPNQTAPPSTALDNAGPGAHDDHPAKAEWSTAPTEPATGNLTFLKGTGFSPYVTAFKKSGFTQVAEKLAVG